MTLQQAAEQALDSLVTAQNLSAQLNACADKDGMWRGLDVHHHLDAIRDGIQALLAAGIEFDFNRDDGPLTTDKMRSINKVLESLD